MDEARPQRIFRDSIFAFTAYTVTAVIGFTLEATQARSFSGYLAPGIGFLLLWRLGTRQWPAVALAAMTALLFRGAQLPFSLFSALTISLTLVLMVHVLRSWGFRSNLSRLRDALHLIGAAALASAGGALAFTVMMTLRDIPNPRFAIASSWIGVFLGMTISAPPFLMWTSRGAGRYDFATVRPLETTFLFLLLFAVCNAAFGETLGTGRAHYPLAFVPFPVLLWIGLRVGPRALVTATSLTAIAAMFGSIRGLGPFTSHTPEANLALDWMFLGSTQLTFLLLASLLTERAEANASLVAAKEHAEAATRAKSEFLSVMNHELRTPLNSILLVTDLMLASDLSSEQRDLGRTVIRASEALSALVSDTLDMARIEDGSHGTSAHRLPPKGALPRSDRRIRRSGSSKANRPSRASRRERADDSAWRLRKNTPGTHQPGRQCTEIHRVRRDRTEYEVCLERPWSGGDLLGSQGLRQRYRRTES